MIALALLIASLHVVDVDPLCTPHVPAAPVPLAPALSSAPPVVVVRDGRVSFDLESARVGDVLAAIASKAGVGIVGNGAGLQAPLVGWVRDAPVAEVIEAVAHSGGLVVWPPPGDPASASASASTSSSSSSKGAQRYVVLPRDDMHAFLLDRMREREKQLPVTTRAVLVSARDGAAWVEPLAKVALSCRGGVEFVERARALLIMDRRDEVDLVERAMMRATPGIERATVTRSERIERSPACPVGAADATNAKAIALARRRVDGSGPRKGAGRIVGCPAPVALVAGDVTHRDVELLDVDPVSPSRHVPYPPATDNQAADDAARARYETERAKQIHVWTRSTVAQAMATTNKPDTVWVVKLPNAASADAFAAVLRLEREAIVARAPNDIVLVRGDVKLDERIELLAAGTPELVRDLPTLAKQRRDEMREDDESVDGAANEGARP